ncbi:unnamed protein product, partial [Rangifer tarandus platyrhynchus]|uniref:Uncharacterized protein n=1 Tax=Rangifer tarandus platyrhynchus TaxID=3082113 RepID=A0AC59YFJ3_RANTA
MLKGLGFVVGFWGREGSSCCPSRQLLRAPSFQPPASPRLEARGSERRREREARDQVPSSPTPSQVPGAGQPLLTGARKRELSPGRGGAGGEQGPQGDPRGRKLPLTQTPRDRPRPPARQPRDGGGGGDPGQERAGEGGGDDSNARPRGRSGAPRGHLRLVGERREGSPGAEGTRPSLPRCLLGEGHL